MPHLTCTYCGLAHCLVEAGGVHYCPNRLCTGPGSWSHRRYLESYRRLEGGGYDVDPSEVLDSVRANTNPDPDIREAEYAAVAKWLYRIGSSKPKVGTDS